jgi:hypothetical protein
MPSAESVAKNPTNKVSVGMRPLPGEIATA